MEWGGNGKAAAAAERPVDRRGRRVSNFIRLFFSVPCQLLYWVLADELCIHILHECSILKGMVRERGDRKWAVPRRPDRQAGPRAMDKPPAPRHQGACLHPFVFSCISLD
jgi:hypothetical protein